MNDSKMTKLDDKYLNRAMPNVVLEDTEIEQVDNLFMWLGRAFGLVAILAAVGYVIRAWLS
jgi:hypothetical protein